MEWQLIVAAMMVGIAMLYLGRQTWRTWTGGRGGCSKGCGCGDKKPTQAALISSDELTVRLREKRGR